jgi:hypothetical protein
MRRLAAIIIALFLCAGHVGAQEVSDGFDVEPRNILPSPSRAQYWATQDGAIQTVWGRQIWSPEQTDLYSSWASGQWTWHLRITVTHFEIWQCVAITPRGHPRPDTYDQCFICTLDECWEDP